MKTLIINDAPDCCVLWDIIIRHLPFIISIDTSFLNYLHIKTFCICHIFNMTIFESQFHYIIRLSKTQSEFLSNYCPHQERLVRLTDTSMDT